jgi:hypothetical protein
MHCQAVWVWHARRVVQIADRADEDDGRSSPASSGWAGTGTRVRGEVGTTTPTSLARPAPITESKNLSSRASS